SGSPTAQSMLLLRLLADQQRARVAQLAVAGGRQTAASARSGDLDLGWQGAIGQQPEMDRAATLRVLQCRMDVRARATRSAHSRADVLPRSSCSAPWARGPRDRCSLGLQTRAYDHVSLPDQSSQGHLRVVL